MTEKGRLIPRDEIFISPLPAELIRDNFIRNLEASYEEYLIEFVNCSSTFLMLSGGAAYMHNDKRSQNKGECDCVSTNYQLDFKILGTESNLYASSNLSKQKAITGNGVLITLIPKQADGMYVARTNQLIMNYTYSDLERLEKSGQDKFTRNNLDPDREMQSIIHSFLCPKNTLFFHDSAIFVKGSYPIESIIAEVEAFMNDCLSEVLKLRLNRIPNKDTYLGMIVQQFFVIGMCKNGSLAFLECIPLSRSPKFLELYQYTNAQFRALLKIGDVV